MLPARRRAAARVRRGRSSRSSRSTGSSGGLRPGPVTGGFRARPGDLGRPARARTRHQRRAEDDGRDHARAGGQRDARPGRLPRAGLGRDRPRPPRSRSGTYVGGWRIIKTMGSRIHKMDAAQGFAAQGAGAASSSPPRRSGFPLSTTHTISGAVIGSGAASASPRCAGGWPGNIIVAWVLTLPAAALFGVLT